MPVALNKEAVNEEVLNHSDTSEQALLQMLAGAWVTQVVSAAAALGIPDALEQHPTRSSQQLAVDAAASPDAVHRLMRALASLGVVSEPAPGQYALTPIGDRLRSSHPNSLRHFFLAETDRVHRRSWEALADAVRTGQPQPLPVFGKSVFDYYQENPEEAEQFGCAMQNVSSISGRAVLANYDFSQARAIVDVGGGNGSFVRAILARYPQSSGVILDLPYIESQAIASIQSDGLADRCRFTAGDVFKTVPPDADIYLLRFILHDWNDDDSRRILRVVRDAAAPGARVLIVEMMLPENNEPGLVQLMDINMLVMTGGRERTGEEYCRLLTESGFRSTRKILTGTPFAIIEGQVV
jgi:ubiquinone/menaquinone biosynthesis C-methylase UbiE